MAAASNADLNTKAGREARLFAIAAPSGGGKTSLVRTLLERDDSLRLSISHTTRPPRPGESDGIDYHFIDEPAFEKLVEAGAFLEHARVFDHSYGTGREAVREQLDQGHHVLLDIDWQGVRQLRAAFPDCCSVFILPPSLEVLRHRLSRRGQDSSEVIERRMRDARAEISHWDEFDYVVVNDDFEAAVEELQAIIRDGRPAHPVPPKKLYALVAELLEDG